MFGMSWTQIIIIVVVGVFLLGPERIPTAVQWVTGSLKKMRGMAQGAQQQLNSELGPEIAEMRRQIAELQGLKEMQSLKELKSLNPRAMITKTIFGTDEEKTAGGVAGLLGLDPSLLTDPGQKPVSAGGPADVTARTAEAGAVSMDKSATAGPATSDPLPLVGGSQEKVQPAVEPDPMPQPDAVPAPHAEPAPYVEPAPSAPSHVEPAPSPQSDPLPKVGATVAPDVVPATAPDVVPAAAPVPAAAHDPVPAPEPAAATHRASAAERTGSRWSGAAPDLRPLVVGGDPLPRIKTPDPLPTTGS